MKKIFIVGSINCDLVMETSVFPKEGETVTGSGFFVSRGGKGANQAIAAARLGGQVCFCGCVGDDTFGKNAIDALNAEGIDTKRVKTVPGAPTGTAVILVHKGNNRIIIEKGANAFLTEKDIDAFLSDATPGDVYLTQLENPINVIGYGLEKAKAKGLITILNPAPANRDVLPYLRYCDILTPNESEAETLGGKRRLLSLVPLLLTTLGEDGYELASKTGVVRHPCPKIRPVDTTAAGDTLCGGLAARLAMGDSPESAALFGSLAATLACTEKGAQASIPTLRKMTDHYKISF